MSRHPVHAFPAAWVQKARRHLPMWAFTAAAWITSGSSWIVVTQVADPSPAGSVIFALVTGTAAGSLIEHATHRRTLARYECQFVDQAAANATLRIELANATKGQAR